MASTWVPGVSAETPFSLANIPFGIISSPADPAPHAAVAIGSRVLDLKVLSSHPAFASLFPALKDCAHVFSQPTLNEFAALGRPVHRDVRRAIQGLLAAETAHPDVLRDNAELRGKALLPRTGVQMHLPMSIGDYTDFYAGFHHAYTVGAMFRGPQAALQPNYTHLPVGYHGRASSIVVSGKSIRRPVGQIILDPTAEPKQPTTAPSRQLDIELELGCFIATPNEMESQIKVADAEDHIFGYVLLNDWSARDIQKWEYVPLGPFNGKNFATTISPWVVLADALEPFRTRGVDNWTPLQAYLNEGKEENVFDIELQVELKTPQEDVTLISMTSSKYLMWSFPQMIAHHTLGGCPLRTGDLLGSGTISGPSPSEKGSFLELSDGGRKDILLYGMDVRRFLKDGDTVTITGICGKPGERVGFGECVGRIQGAAPL
ncbi:Fumarylacetoacetase [Durotheca rogersii]|uniref:Fumarylacetoacetase n=1 Tax=Durotheca rogersii TaxID=419775 RepID=UPI0022209D98|nr:Fumarylacetoacetase [Durotheca rogersii]KAI5861468.1 Fumarylacetoacetase [Durotheca rogersii]